MDLGQTSPGGRKSHIFRLTNQSAVHVEVDEITSGCECLRIDLPERRLEPGQQVEGSIELDLRKDPQFLGNLAINVKGRDKNGEAVFEMEIRVPVEGD